MTTRAHLTGLTLCAALLASITLPDDWAGAVDSRTNATEKTTQQKAKKATRSKAKSKDSQKQQADAAGQSKNLEDGISATKAGKYDLAVTELSSAINSGGLKFTDTARALYYRGLAYRHLEKHDLAIADLTSALWKKNALVGSERAGALAERAAAYRAAGLSDQGVASTNASQPGPQTMPQERSIAAVPASAPPPAPKTTPPAAWTTRSRTAPEPQSKNGSNGSSLLTNLFGSSKTQNQVAPPEKQPAATAKTDRRLSQSSSWSTVSRTPVTGAPAPGRAAQTVAATPAGQIRIQIAALRNQREAETLARQVVERHRTLVASRQPTVEPGVLGNMGTMYHVRLGPFRTPDDTKPLCAKLISDGLDCLVLTKN